MDKLLRSCYKEMNVWGMNTPILEKRANAIIDILDNDSLSEEEYLVITNWLMGFIEKPEDILIKLEVIFCKHDEKFSLDREEFREKENKEIVILCMALLYEYCSKEKNCEFPMQILCGDGIGYKLKSRIMTEKFGKMVSECRIALREDKNVFLTKEMESLSDIKEMLDVAINENSSCEIETPDIKKIIEQIEICQENIKILETNENHYRINMQAKSEEANLLWWMVTEWSECYEESYQNMTAMEAAVTVPIELYDQVKFELYPYTAGQMVRKILSVTKEFTEQEYSLYDIVKSARKKLNDNKILNFEKININNKLQPILYALSIKSQTENEEDWPVLFRTVTGYEMEDLRMSALNFSLQLCRELELLKYYENKE